MFDVKEKKLMKIFKYSAVCAALFLSGCAAGTPTANNSAANSNVNSNANLNGNSNARTNSATAAATADNGLKTLKSLNNFEETYAKLKSAVEKNDALKIISEIDHAGNADKNGLKLRPTKLMIFGNPKLGTPLMQQAQSLAIDLPQKMLVYETETGEVFVTYNDPFYLAKRHNVSESREEFIKIATALKTLAETATGK